MAYDLAQVHLRGDQINVRRYVADTN